MVEMGRVEPGWIDNFLKPTIKRNLIHLSRMAYPGLVKHPALFEFMGVDFLFDEDLNLWFLELNTVPGMTGTTKAKKI